MAFGGSWGRGIGGLRGQFQQAQQMGQFNPGGLQQQWGPQPMQQMGQLGGMQQQLRERQVLQKELASPQITGFPAPRPYGGGAGFARPLSPPPSAPSQAGGGAGGAPTSWKMSIEPMAGGGMIPGYQNGGYMPPYGMAGGGEVPMVYANGGYIPAYGLGGWLKRNVLKPILKVAPIAAPFIPGIGPLTAGAIGAIGGAGSRKLEGGSWGDALQRGIMTGMGSYAGAKGLQGAKKGWGKTFIPDGMGGPGKWISDPRQGGFFGKLEGALGGLKDQFSMEDLLKIGPMIKAQEAMGMGHAGGAGGPASGRISTAPAGAAGGGGRPAGGGTITDVGAPASRVYNLFSHFDQLAPRGQAGGGYVDNLYATRRFGGGPIPEYGIGGWLKGRGVKGPVSTMGGIGGLRVRAPKGGKKRGGSGMEEGLWQRPYMPQRRFEGGEEEFMRPAVMPPPPPPATIQPAVMPAPPMPLPTTAALPAISPSPPPAPLPPLAPPPRLKAPDPDEERQQRAHAKAEGERWDSWRKTEEELEARKADAARKAVTASIAEQIQDLVPQTAAAMPPPPPSGRNEGIGDEFVERGSGKELGGEFEGFEPYQPQVPALPPVVSSPAYSPTPDYSPVDVWGNPIIDEDDVKGYDEDQAEELAFIRKEQRTNPAAGQAALRDAAARDAKAAATTTPPPPPAPTDPPPPPVSDLVMPTQGGYDTLGDLFESSGYDPFSMPTTAGEFAAAGDQGTADMLNRINASAAPIESYVPAVPTERYVPPPPPVAPVVLPARQAGGPVAPTGIIEELAQDETGSQVLNAVIEALQSPDNPESEQTIAGFEEAFPGALEELMGMIGQSEQTVPMQAGGLIPGDGDAMADDRLGIVNPGEPDSYPILTSDGEFVIAGDVVAGLGSGNSRRGEAVLNQLQEDVRMNRTGSPEQSPPIDLSDVLPGTYGEEYA